MLKTKGYLLEHNFGHGKAHPASLLATLNRLAFGLHTFLELADADYQLIRTTVGARRTFFAHLRALTREGLRFNDAHNHNSSLCESCKRICSDLLSTKQSRYVGCSTLEIVSLEPANATD